MDQRPVTLGELGAGGDPAGVRPAFSGVEFLSGTYELDEDPLQRLSLGPVRPGPEPLIRVARQGALHTAELLVGGGGQPTPLLPLPQPAQGVRQHRQRRGTGWSVPQHPLDQAVGEPDSRTARQRTGDHLCQLVPHHRLHHHRRGVPCRTKVGELFDVAKEVDPDDDHGLGGVASVGAAVRQDPEHGVQPAGGARRVGEQCLELAGRTRAVLRRPRAGGRAPALNAYLRWRNKNARHPDVLAAQRRERARIRSEKGIRWGGRPLASAA